jgi:FKBP-type peptidyl-prolyl cis-trans isomerase SlyD
MIIEENRVVSIEYEMSDSATKEVLDSNKGMEPLSFIVGKGQIIAGLESKIQGMKAGEQADILVKPEDGYGEYNDELIQTLPAEQFAGIELEEGMPLYGQSEDGQTVQVMVKAFDDSEVTIDYNHPMAGVNMMFSLTVTDVREATEEELACGHVGGHGGGEGCCGSGGGSGCGCSH